MADHERIYLQPGCCADDRREWSAHSDVWDTCPDHGKATEYVRADLYDDLVKTANIVVARYAEATHSSGDFARLEDALNALSDKRE